MLRRKISDYLSNWKASHKQECLLVNGARQVGKSFAITQFGKSHYTSLVTIDFVKNPQYKAIFRDSLDPKDIYSQITLHIPGVELIEHNTLIFIDEIQECPEARSAFKYLAQDDRFDVVGSGSLLGVRFRELDDSPSLPVGYERQISMHPLDFEEFLWAKGYDEVAIAELEKYYISLEPLPQGLHQTMMKTLREFLAIGGMPAVVDSFSKERDYGAAHDAQSKLHQLYLDDIARYAPAHERVKARSCYMSLPRQLAKENTRFRYASVEKRSGARKFEGSIDWLVGANIVSKCQAVSTLQFPLASYEDEERFRLYANDTGMLLAMFDFSMKSAVIENTLQGPMKGGLYENLVASMFVAQDVPLRYWMSSKSKHEIEFVFDRQGALCPVEVKSSRGATASLNAVLSDKTIPCGYKLIDGNIGQVGKKITLPLYMAMFLAEDFGNAGKE